MRSAGHPEGPTRNPLRNGAARLAGIDRLPTSLQALIGYYADTGTLDYQAVRIKSHVDTTIETIIADAYTDIEATLAAELDLETVTFEYETKLTMPAELTVGYLYREVLGATPPGTNPLTEPTAIDRLRMRLFGNGGTATPTDEMSDRVAQIQRVTRLVVEALIDGDMRDAINDEEYEDFEVTTGEKPVDTARVAELAQQTLQTSVERQLETFPAAVTDAYEAAVEISEGHQDADERYRSLLAADDAQAAIESEYKFASFDEPPELYDEAIRSLPYFRTQYERVGVIYEGMLDVYRAAGFEISPAFEQAVVLAVIGAQIWLDDVDDYQVDAAEGQLTPVTAEYRLAATDDEAYENIVGITETYLRKAQEFATAAETPMTGIAIEYIYRAGKPHHLPRGSEYIDNNRS